MDTLKIIMETLVLVEGGSFKMGDTFGDGYEDEGPVHDVSVGSFMLSKHELTQEIWEFVMHDNPSHFRGKDRPVEQINWFSAVEFCNKLSLLAGFEPCYEIKDTDVKCDFTKDGFRLPTEAEWEFAAKGGCKGRQCLYSGSNLVDKVAWYRENSNNMSHPVGLKEPNELGLFDMSGNLWEWCWDLWGLHQPQRQENPKGPESGTERVFRGGTWYQDSYYLRVSHRFRRKPDTTFYGIGFRLAKNV